MLEVIQDVIQAEERAQKIVEDARKKASERRNDFADTEASELKEAQNRADRILREGLSEARQTADSRVEAARSRLEETELNIETEHEQAIKTAVARAVQLVVGLETDG